MASEQIEGIDAPYPGFPLREGMSGPDAERAARWLGRPLSADDIIDWGAWYRLQYAHTTALRFSELATESELIGQQRTPPAIVINEGTQGQPVLIAQFLINFIAQFYANIPTVTQNSSFTRDMSLAVRAFQAHNGLLPDGIIGGNTWQHLYDMYWEIRDYVDIPVLIQNEPAPLPCDCASDVLLPSLIKDSTRPDMSFMMLFYFMKMLRGNANLVKT